VSVTRRRSAAASGDGVLLSLPLMRFGWIISPFQVYEYTSTYLVSSLSRCGFVASPSHFYRSYPSDMPLAKGARRSNRSCALECSFQVRPGLQACLHTNGPQYTTIEAYMVLQRVVTLAFPLNPPQCSSSGAVMGKKLCCRRLFPAHPAIVRG